MKNIENIKLAATVGLAIVIAPVVILGVKEMVTETVGAVGYVWNEVAFKNKVRKGLKKGSIVEVDGKYFEVETVEEA